MKKGIVYFILLAFLFFIFPSFSEELELEVEEPIEIISPIEEEIRATNTVVHSIILLSF